MNRHVGHMVSKEQGGLRVEERVGDVGRQRLLHGRARCDAVARVRGELHLALLLRSAGAAAALSPVWPKSPTYRVLRYRLRENGFESGGAEGIHTHFATVRAYEAPVRTRGTAPSHAIGTVTQI